MDERFCDSCGTEVPLESAESQPNVASMPQDEPMIGAGARVNATGGIHKTTHQHVNVNTSQVDNSQTVNNTTIVMESKSEVQYCEVCGNPLGEKHPRCPRCGKQICFDCKVKGKNRCVECEKKAREEYRVAFQQLMLTTNGQLGAAGRQMLNQKARELDVEDVKGEIEKELTEFFRAQRPQQPNVVEQHAVRAAAAAGTSVAASTTRGGSTGNRGTFTPNDLPSRRGEAADDTNKGMGALTGGQGLNRTNNGTPQGKHNEGGGNRMLWFGLGGVAAVALIAFMAFGGGGEKTTPASNANASQQIEQTAQPTAAPAQPTPVVAPAAQKVATPAPATQSTPVKPQRDTNYEAGMAAYNKGEALEAIAAFKKSGSAQSNYMLGVIYESGLGNVGSNAMLARKFFKKAAAQGSAEAKAKLN